MRTRRDILIAFVVLFSVLPVALILPRLMSDSSSNEVGFSISRPTRTPFQPVNSGNTRATATPSPVPNTGCTYPVYYWAEQPDLWPAEVILGNQPYTREELLEIFKSGSTDAHSRIIRQLHTTYLNVLNGADMNAIESVIVDANNWLAANPVGSKLSEFNSRRGIDLAAILEGYNRGIYGPGLCSDAPAEPEPPTQTPTPTLTATFTPEPPSPTNPPPTRRVVVPTAVEIPPTQPPPTQVLPTQAPSPTAAPPTQAPSPTLAPTQAPTQPSTTEPTLAPPTITSIPLPTLAPGDP